MQIVGDRVVESSRGKGAREGKRGKRQKAEDRDWGRGGLEGRKPRP